MAELSQGLLLSLAPKLISGCLQILQSTVTVEYQGAQPLLDSWQRGEPSLLSFWHNRVVMMPIVAAAKKPRSPISGGRNVCILNSRSRDGEIATRALHRWGIESVRGSTHRGGTAGFLQLLRAHRRGLDLALVPDGSRGPRYVAKAGIIHLARATGTPLWPLAWAADRYLQLRSWDRLIVPLPFARIVFVVGEPIRVGRDLDDRGIEATRAELETRLNRVTAIADQAIGRSPR